MLSPQWLGAKADHSRSPQLGQTTSLSTDHEEQRRGRLLRTWSESFDLIYVIRSTARQEWRVLELLWLSMTIWHSIHRYACPTALTGACADGKSRQRSYWSRTDN